MEIKNISIQRKGNTYNATPKNGVWYVRNVNGFNLTGTITILKNGKYQFAYQINGKDWVTADARLKSIEVAIALLVDVRNS